MHCDELAAVTRLNCHEFHVNFEEAPHWNTTIFHMMMPWHGKVFHITGLLWGESTGEAFFVVNLKKLFNKLPLQVIAMVIMWSHCSRPISQIPLYICSISHNIPFGTELWEMEQVHCGICELGHPDWRLQPKHPLCNSSPVNSLGPSDAYIRQ